MVVLPVHHIIMIALAPNDLTEILLFCFFWCPSVKCSNNTSSLLFLNEWCSFNIWIFDVFLEEQHTMHSLVVHAVCSVDQYSAYWLIPLMASWFCYMNVFCLLKWWAVYTWVCTMVILQNACTCILCYAQSVYKYCLFSSALNIVILS